MYDSVVRPTDNLAFIKSHGYIQGSIHIRKYLNRLFSRNGKNYFRYAGV